MSIFYGLRKVLPYNLIWGEELERAVSGELSLQRGVIFCNKSWGSGKSLVGLQRGSQQRGKDPAWKSLVRCGVEIVGRNIGATTERLCGSKESLGFSLNYGLRREAEVL